MLARRGTLVDNACKLTDAFKKTKTHQRCLARPTLAVLARHRRFVFVHVTWVCWCWCFSTPLSFMWSPPDISSAQSPFPAKQNQSLCNQTGSFISVYLLICHSFREGQLLFFFLKNTFGCSVIVQQELVVCPLFVFFFSFFLFSPCWHRYWNYEWVACLDHVMAAWLWVILGRSILNRSPW